MFVFEPDEPVPSTELQQTAERLRELAEDLDAFAEMAWPTLADLRDAPLIDGYAPYLVAAPSLIGLVTGHAALPGKERRIATLGAVGHRQGARLGAHTESLLSTRPPTRRGAGAGVAAMTRARTPSRKSAAPTTPRSTRAPKSPQQRPDRREFEFAVPEEQSSVPLPTLEYRAEGYLLFCRLRAALRYLVMPGMSARTIALRLAPEDSAASVHTVIRELCSILDVDFGLTLARTADDAIDLAAEVSTLEREMRRRVAIVLVPSSVELSSVLRDHCDADVKLAPATPRHIAALVHRTTRQHPSPELLEALCALPLEHLSLMLRDGRTHADLVRHVERLSRSETGRRDTAEQPTPDPAATPAACGQPATGESSAIGHARRHVWYERRGCVGQIAGRGSFRMARRQTGLGRY